MFIGRKKTVKKELRKNKYFMLYAALSSSRINQEILSYNLDLLAFNRHHKSNCHADPFLYLKQGRSNTE